jgi:hypothetical protein
MDRDVLNERACRDASGQRFFVVPASAGFVCRELAF